MAPLAGKPPVSGTDSPLETAMRDLREDFLRCDAERGNGGHDVLQYLIEFYEHPPPPQFTSVRDYLDYRFEDVGCVFVKPPPFLPKRKRKKQEKQTKEASEKKGHPYTLTFFLLATQLRMRMRQILHRIKHQPRRPQAPHPTPLPRRPPLHRQRPRLLRQGETEL